MKKLLLALIGVLMALPMVARNFTYTYEGQTVTYTVIDEIAKTCMTKEGQSSTPGNSASGDLKIPAYANDGNNDYKVITIGFRSFYNRTSITSVEIPATVTEIAQEAFYRCIGLTSIELPNSVTTLGFWAFRGCENITEIRVPENPVYINQLDFSPEIYNSAKLIVPENAIVSYLCSNWSLFSNIVYGESNSMPIKYADADFNYLMIPETKEAIITSRINKTNPVLNIKERFTYSEDGTQERYYIKGIGVKAFEDEDIQTLTFNSKSVLEYVGDNAFKGTKVTTITLPNTVTRIYSQAFYECTELTSVTLPDALQTIGSSAFYGCTGLTSVIFPEGGLQTIGMSAFAECSSLTSVTFPEGLQTIDSSVFYGCTGLTSVRFPESLQAIGSSAFFGCIGLKSVTFPEGLETIGSSAFYGCTGLTSVPFPESLQTIGSSAFYGCTGLTSVIFPEGLQTISSEVFQGCTGLVSITFPDGLQTIGMGAFAECSSLTSVTFPDGLQTIGRCAFEGCAGLTTVALPEGLQEIYSYAFRGCTGLTSIIFPEGLQTISDGIFGGCTSLTSVAFPEGLQRIDDGAFYGCTGLTSITFPDGLQTIYHEAFRGCTGLTSITFPEGLQTIDREAFMGCTGLKSVTFSEGLQTLGSNAFRGCTGLTSVSLPGSLNFSMGESDEAFTECVNLTDMTFEYGKEDITTLDYILNGYVRTLTLNRNVRYPYGRLGSVTTLILGNDVTYIADGAFRNSSNLTSLTLGSNIKTIGANAFSGCTGLTEVVIPPSVETIGANAFQGNTALETIIMGRSVKEIGEMAFDGCAAKTVSITAQEPPVAPLSVFSNYDGKLLVQGDDALDAYYDSFDCWGEFDSDLLIRPYNITYQAELIFNGKRGDTFQISAELIPENVSLPHIFWRSTNPEIATVDANGLVTLRKDLTDVMMTAVSDDEDDTESDNGECQIIAETLYHNAPFITVDVKNRSFIVTGVESVDSENEGAIDYTRPIEVYNLNGMRIGETTANLLPGIYVVRQGSNSSKITVI